VTGSSQTAIERPASTTQTDRQLDTLLPPEMAARAEGVGVRKVRLDAVSLFALAVLAGAFISLGDLTIQAFLFANLLPVTIGKLIGGVLMVGIVCWFVYLRGDRRAWSEASSDAQIMS
jgi:formate/nitrite transporter FocA (FNT family)